MNRNSILPYSLVEQILRRGSASWAVAEGEIKRAELALTLAHIEKAMMGRCQLAET